MSLPARGVDFTQIEHKQIGDMRDDSAWKADSGVTNNWPVVARLIAAGYKQIWWPANTSGIAPGGLIPAGLVIYGEDWITSVIKSASDPTTATLKAGPGAKLYNLNLQGNTSNTPTNSPIAVWINSSDLTANIVTTGFGAFHSVGGISGVDITPAFFQVIDGLGDALNGSSGANATGGGNGARFDVYPSGAGAVYVGRHSNAPGVQINDLADYSSATVGPQLSLFSTTLTSGAMVTFNQRTSTFAGNVLNINMADVSGTYSGIPFLYQIGGVSKFQVNNDGSISFGVGNTSPKILTGTGSPAGVISAAVGSLYLRTDGGTSTTLYVKESGANGNTGWVAK